MGDNGTMSGWPGRKLRLCLRIAAALALLLVGGHLRVAAGAQPFLPRPPVQVLHSQQADLVYEHRRHLEELALKMGVAPPAPGLPPEVGLLALRIDAMLTEISRTLNRRPATPVKLTIRLLPDATAVWRQYETLRPSRPSQPLVRGGPLPAFYEPRSRTIYLSVADARVGMLAHEMTHFILCESSGSWPSEAFQESLARYLEERFNTGRSGP